LFARDRLVLEGCAEHGIPAVVTLGGGYARRVSDTVRIHQNTCELAMRLASGAGDRGSGADAGPAPGAAHGAPGGGAAR
jgi:hypothetical protein